MWFQLFANTEFVRNYSPVTVGLAAVAVIGYLVGRWQRMRMTADRAHSQREVRRARGVARNLEVIARNLRRELARHSGSLTRFKQRMSKMKDVRDKEEWDSLCKEAEQMLGPTLHLASQIAHAYDQIRQQTGQLMTFSEVRTDPLTGICNRRAMDDALNSMISMRNRYDVRFSLALFDIDHFKRINDELGHLAGDDVLKSVARFLDDTARETDTAVRFGGEEFVVLLPQTDLKGAIKFAERSRAIAARTLGITISGGVVEADDFETADDLLGRADTALYAAKAAGRNYIFQHHGEGVEMVPRTEADDRPAAAKPLEARLVSISSADSADDLVEDFEVDQSSLDADHFAADSPVATDAEQIALLEDETVSSA